jgi:putative tryptophan/tyrosine transport system substrate-binding protein
MNRIRLGIALFVFGIFLFMRMQQPTHTAAYTIGILQTASHPALDATHEGFVEELKNLMGDDIAFVTQNAQGSIANVHAIAQQFHAKSQYAGFFAIATPAAQSLSTIEKERPIFIAAVSDPDSLGLIHPNTNVCGTKDMIDVQGGIDLLTQLVPNAKKIGLLYSSGEANSTVLVKKMRQDLEGRGLTVAEFAMSNEADMQAMVESACGKVDALLAPTDNMIGSAVSAIAAIALKHKKPFIVSDNMLVKEGALAAHGVDYKAGGKRAAQIAHEVLVEGKKPYELPVERIQDGSIFINQKTLDTLGLSIPDALKERAVIVS